MMKIHTALALFGITLFVITGCTQHGEVDKSKPGGLYEINEHGKEFKTITGEETFMLDTSSFIPFSDFKSIQQEYDYPTRDYVLGFRLTEAGALKFKEMTERNINQRICFVVGDKILAAPEVMTSIPNGRGVVQVVDKTAFDEVMAYLTK